MQTPRIYRAIVSVSKQQGLAELARGLFSYGVRLIATDGTRTALSGAGFEVQDMRSLTGKRRIMEGRVQTLDYHVHGGILADMSKESHLMDLQFTGIQPIDLVVVNPYPFEETVKHGAEEDRCINQIDIGGLAMLRAGAKNFRRVTAVCDPDDYPALLSEMRAHDGATSLLFRRQMAAKVFAISEAYDRAVRTWMEITHPENER